MHIGSQITEAGPIAAAVEKVGPLAEELKAKFGIGYFSIGGGIGIVYRDALASGLAAWWDAQPEGKRPLTPGELRSRAGSAARPARSQDRARTRVTSLVGNAGVLLTRVEYLKRGHGKNFLVVDAAMNDLIRPAMYEAYHEIVPLHRDTTRRALVADVVGPVCESSDCFAKDRPVQEVGEGEYLALMSAGAYGKTMASRYNARPLPAEVLIKGSAFELVGARETLRTR